MQNCYTLFISNTSFRLNILAGAPRVNHSHGSNSVLLPLSSILCRKKQLHNCAWKASMILISQHNLPGTASEWWCELWSLSDPLFQAVPSQRNISYSQVFCVTVLCQGPDQSAEYFTDMKDRLRETRSCVFCISSSQHWVKTTQHLSLHCCVVWSTWTSNLYG